MSARLPWSRLIRNLFHAPPAEAAPHPPDDLVAALAAQAAKRRLNDRVQGLSEPDLEEARDPVRA